jgi:peptide deformylase
MILSIYAYGQPVLKKKAVDIPPDLPGLKELIANMWDTMYAAHGVGLAAPQVGQSIRLFMIDSIQIMDEGKENEGIKQVFINARIIEETGKPWFYDEGCLSIPNIRGEVERKPVIRIRYMDEDFNEHENVFDGINARVIQHEYDHIEGILFTDLLSPVKKSLIRRKMENIRRGKADADYKLKFVR